MTRQEFIDRVNHLVTLYMQNADSFDGNPQLEVNPETLSTTIVNGSDFLQNIAYNDLAVEEAAGVSTEQEDGADTEVRLNPDFYSVSRLIKPIGNGAHVLNDKTIAEVADIYFKE